MISLLVVMHVYLSDAFKYYRLDAEEYMEEEEQDVPMKLKVHHAPGKLGFLYIFI